MVHEVDPISLRKANGLIEKLNALRPSVEAAQIAIGERVTDTIERQRQLEGIRAAVRDPVSGVVYSGWTHQAAIESVPPSDQSGAWGRLHCEWDRATDNAGFLDRNGVFISRREAEARWDVLTMEDIKDARNYGRSRPGSNS